MSAVSLIQKLSSSFLSKSELITSIVSVLAIFGTAVMISGGIWDATSHIRNEPEFFWTIQHIAVYSGVAMTASAAILGSIFVIKNYVGNHLQKGIKIVIVGSIIQIFAGLGDSISHDVFGIDGLVSWSHQPLEFGLVLCALGGFLIIKSTNNKKLKKILPVSIMTLILAVSWLGFNLSLFVGGTILCLPFYEMFSSGCAIL
ncbi:MAG: hypothetical protein ACE5EJ_02880 [Nitrosopumilaceae archaeon]